MSKRILIIDDSRVVRQQVKQALVEAGFEVVEAYDGVDGIEKLRENPDTAMVLCDINMPRLNGLAMIEQIMAEGGNRSLPIVVLTTEGQPEMVNRAKRAGAKGWIVKPFKAELLVAAARRLTGGP